MDVRLSLAHGARRCDRRTRVLLHIGTAETPAWIVPRSPIEAGGAGLARIVLERALPVRGGDRFLIRSASPARPVGGGHVIDPRPPHRVAWSDDLALDGDGARLRALVMRRRQGVTLLDLPLLTGLPPRTAERTARRDPALTRIGDRIVARASVERAAGQLRQALDRFHATHPADAGMPLETLRRATAAPGWMSETALRSAEAAGALVIEGPLVRTREFRPKVSGGDAVLLDVVQRLEAAGLAPPTAAELGVSTRREDMPVILRVAAADGLIVRVERDRYFARKALEEFEAALRELGRDGEIGIGALRERLGLSRKYLIPLLEWADREGLTVRIGDTRRLRPSSSG